MKFSLLQKLMEGPEQRAAERATKLVAAGKLEQAIEALRAGVEKVPGSVPLRLELARVLGVANRREEAASALRSLLRAEPAAVDVVRELVEMSRLQGQDVAHFHDALAEHALRKGDLAAAQDHLERIERQERVKFVEVQRKRFVTAEKGGEAKSSRAALLAGVYVAVAHEASAEDAKALDTYERLLAADPSLYPQIRTRLFGMATRNYRNGALRLRVLEQYLGRGDTDSAAKETMLLLQAVPDCGAKVAEQLDVALSREPASESLRLALARARWAEGKDDEAIAVLDPIAVAGGRDSELAGLLTEWRVQRPDAARAALMLAEVLGRHDKGAQALQTIADVASKLAPEELEPALERLSKEYEGDGRVYRMLAELRVAHGDVQGAMRAVAEHRRCAPGRGVDVAGVLRQALTHDPNHVGAHEALAEFMLERGDTDSALVLLRHLVGLDAPAALRVAPVLEKVVAANPALPEARMAAAQAWIAAGDPPRALGHLEAAATHPATAGEAAHHLSLVLARAPKLASRVREAADLLEGKLGDPAALPFLRAETAAAMGDPETAAQCLGECYGLAGWRGAEAISMSLETLLGAHPGSSAVRMLLAHILADRSEPARAVEVVAGAPDPDPGMVSLLLDRLEGMMAGRPRDAALRSGLARLLLVAGRAQEALAAAEEALRVAGAAAPGSLHLVRADALLAAGERLAAVTSLARAAEADRSLIAAVGERLGEIRQAAPRDIPVRLALARLLGVQGKIGGALDLLVEVGLESPQGSTEALREVATIEAARPGDAAPAFAAARLLGAAGRPAEAANRAAAALANGARTAAVEGLLAEVLERHPGQPDLLLTLGRSRAARQPEEACELLQRAAGAGTEAATRALAGLAEIAAARPDLAAPALAAARIHHYRGDAAAAFAALRPVLAGEPSHGALDLLAALRHALPDDPAPALASARAALDAARIPAARSEIAAATALGARPDEIVPLLDRLVEQLPDDPDVRLARARARVPLGEVAGAVADLEAASAAGRTSEACSEAEAILASRPADPGARRLHLDLLAAAGRTAEQMLSLAAGIASQAPDEFRCDLLLERADLRRQAGEEEGAARDLDEAQRLSHDRDAFLARIQARRARRLEVELVAASGAQRAQLLLDLGRLEEAEAALGDAALADDERRGLRVELLLARGEAAACVSLLRSEPPGWLLVDAARRCDRPGLALAALDRLLEGADDEALRRVRARVLQDIWRRDLDFGSEALVGRTSFSPPAS
jgi:predicted Zn-dependent protease